MSTGITLLSELFVQTKDPTYIFNQARCFEQNARYPEAITRFQEFLRVGKKLSKEERATAEKHIDDCEELQAKQAAPAQAPAVVPPQPQVQPRPEPSPPSPLPQPAVVSTDVARPAERPPETDRGSRLRVAGVITAAVGGAALVAGVILNLKVNSMASDYETLNGYTDGKESDRKTYEALGWTSYGIGAACVATGAVLYYLGVRAGQQPSVAVAGTSDGVSAIWRRAF